MKNPELKKKSQDVERITADIRAVSDLDRFNTFQINELINHLPYLFKVQEVNFEGTYELQAFMPLAVNQQPIKVVFAIDFIEFSKNYTVAELAQLVFKLADQASYIYNCLGKWHKEESEIKK